MQYSGLTKWYLHGLPLLAVTGQCLRSRLSALHKSNLSPAAAVTMYHLTTIYFRSTSWLAATAAELEKTEPVICLFEQIRKKPCSSWFNLHLHLIVSGKWNDNDHTAIVSGKWNYNDHTAIVSGKWNDNDHTAVQCTLVLAGTAGSVLYQCRQSSLSLAAAPQTDNMKYPESKISSIPHWLSAKIC